MGFERFRIQYEFSMPGSKQMLDSDLNGLYGIVKDPRTTMPTDEFPVVPTEALSDPDATQDAEEVKKDKDTEETPVTPKFDKTAVIPVAAIFSDTDSIGIRETEILPVAQTEQ